MAEFIRLWGANHNGQLYQLSPTHESPGQSHYAWFIQRPPHNA